VVEDTMPEAHFESLENLERSYWWHQHRVRLAALLAGRLDFSQPRLLDIGCGTGGFLQQFAGRIGAAESIGIETSPYGIEACRAKGLEVVDQDLMQPVNLSRGVFQLATAMDVLEHLPDERPALRLVHENLAEGGHILISVPALPQLWSTWDEHLGHFRRYTVPSLRQVLEEEQYEINYISYAFGFAVIPAWGRRLFGQEYTEDTCEFPPVPGWLNAALSLCGKVEAGWLRIGKLPMGLSVVALARKK